MKGSSKPPTRWDMIDGMRKTFYKNPIRYAYRPESDQDKVLGEVRRLALANELVFTDTSTPQAAKLSAKWSNFYSQHWTIARTEIPVIVYLNRFACMIFIFDINIKSTSSGLRKFVIFIKNSYILIGTSSGLRTPFLYLFVNLR